MVTIHAARKGCKRSKQAKPGADHSGGPALRLKIDGKERSVAVADLLKPEIANRLAKSCSKAEKIPVFYLDNLLGYDKRDRYVVLDFIASIKRCRPAIGKDRFPNILDAALHVMVGNADMTLYERGKLAALEAAVLIFPEALEGACSRVVVRLAELGVKGVKTADILSDAKRILKELYNRPVLVDRVERPVRDVFPDAPVAESVVIPAGWKVTADGLLPARGEDGGVGLSAPVLIIERGRDAHRGTEMVTLAWQRAGKWQKNTVDRKIIANARTIVDLAGVGLPVTSNNARTLVQYLDDFEAANLPHLPAIRVSQKMGWQGEDGKDGFLWGRNLITANGISQDNAAAGQQVQFRGSDEGGDQLADSFRQAGTYEGWLRGIRELRHHPSALLALYASFAPAMLPILKAPNFVIDFAGENTSGKTTALRGAASVWGNPDERSGAAVLATWNSTATWRERVTAICSHLPILLDDTKNVRFPDEVAKTIYSVVQGRARGRGTIQGIAHQDYCETILFSSGEQPATSFTKDGGTRPRVLSFWGSPFGAVSPQMAQRICQINQRIRDNYGHAGPRFIQYLFAHRHEWEQWRTGYQEDVRYFEEAAEEDAVVARMASHFAAITLTAYLVHEALDLPWEWNDPLVPVWEQLINVSGDANVASNALRMVIDWAVAHRQDFFHQHASVFHPPHGGWVGRWDKVVGGNNSGNADSFSADWFGILPHVLDRVLHEGQFDSESNLRTWKARGWLETDDENRNTKRTKIGSDLARVIAIRREAVNAVSGV